VPWRFSDAGRLSAWIGSPFRRPKTCTRAAARGRIWNIPCQPTGATAPRYGEFVQQV
jgi:hypothetical protein